MPALQHDGHGKRHQQEVGHDVARRRDDQVNIALAALAAGVGQDLPVPREGVALSEGGDKNTNEGYDEEDARVE